MNQSFALLSLPGCQAERQQGERLFWKANKMPFVIIREVATNEFRLCQVPAGTVLKPHPDFRFSDQFASRERAKNPNVLELYRLQKQLFSDHPQQPKTVKAD